jgi:hypothetical protein
MPPTPDNGKPHLKFNHPGSRLNILFPRWQLC